MQKKREEDLEKKALLEQLKGKENITKSGQKINVMQISEMHLMLVQS